MISGLRQRTASPKLRYDIGDLGRAVRFADVTRALRTFGVEPAALAATVWPLPCLFVYGRADTTVAFYGCKITPADLEEVVYSLPELASRVASFALLLAESAEADKLLTFAFELEPGAEPPDDDGIARLRDATLARLADVNQDYREASRMLPPGLEPRIELFANGTGPFAGYASGSSGATSSSGRPANGPPSNGSCAWTVRGKADAGTRIQQRTIQRHVLSSSTQHIVEMSLAALSCRQEPIVMPEESEELGRTEAERWFERYLHQHAYAFRYEPDLGVPSRPDFHVTRGPVEFICEVKGFEQVPALQSGSLERTSRRWSATTKSSGR